MEVKDIKKARYIRTSTEKQNNARQLKDDNSKLYIDVCSGTIPFSKREKGSILIKDIIDNKINYLSVHSVSRLGRNLIDILNTLEFFKENNVNVKIDNLGIESIANGKSNQAFELIITVLAQVSQMERETLLERQREGIKKAVANGKYKGRKKGVKMSDEDVLKKYKQVVNDIKKGHSVRDIARMNNVSKTTVMKVRKIRRRVIIKDYREFESENNKD